MPITIRLSRSTHSSILCERIPIALWWSHGWRICAGHRRRECRTTNGWLTQRQRLTSIHAHVGRLVVWGLWRNMCRVAVVGAGRVDRCYIVVTTTAGEGWSTRLSMATLLGHVIGAELRKLLRHRRHSKVLRRHRSINLLLRMPRSRSRSMRVRGS